MANRLPGTTIASLKKHPELIPLFASVGFGVVLCAGYVARLALLCPDVTWNRTANPEPWNKWKQTDRYKFMKMHDYKTAAFPAERPDMSNDKYSG